MISRMPTKEGLSLIPLSEFRGISIENAPNKNQRGWFLIQLLEAVGCHYFEEIEDEPFPDRFCRFNCIRHSGSITLSHSSEVITSIPVDYVVEVCRQEYFEQTGIWIELI